MASPETWAMVIGAIPGYLAIIGGLYTFLSSRGKRWAREFAGFDDLCKQHKEQSERLDTVVRELRGIKVVSMAQNGTINGLARVLASLDGVDPEDVPVMREGDASEAMYDDTTYSADDFTGRDPTADD